MPIACRVLLEVFGDCHSITEPMPVRAFENQKNTAQAPVICSQEGGPCPRRKLEEHSATPGRFEVRPFGSSVRKLLENELELSPPTILGVARKSGDRVRLPDCKSPELGPSSWGR